MKRRIGRMKIFFGTGLVIAFLFIFSFPGKSAENQPTPSNALGEKIFTRDCASCHPGGGNVITPNLPVRGAPQLSNFDSFLGYLRKPTMPNGSPGPMPAFSEGRITDEQARNLYQYLVKGSFTSQQGRGGGYGMGPGYGYGYGMGPGMMGPGRGYGMGPGMMGPGRGYGMGPGMMGPGYGNPYGPQYGPQYGPGPQYQQQNPLDMGEAKNRVENYLKATRNPNLKLGELKDKGSHFEADIVTKKGNSLVDKIYVDKNTGWMRSAY